MFKKIVNIVAAMSLAAVASLTSYAASDEDSVAYVKENGELRIICEDNSGALGDVRWDVYHLGSRSYDTFTLTDAFKPLESSGTQDAFVDGVGVDLTKITDEDVESVVNCFQEYIEDNKIKNDYSFVTDAEGVISETLPNGMYLLIMEDFERDDAEWTATPALVEINGEWEEDGTDVYPKISSRPVETPPKTGYTEELAVYDCVVASLIILVGIVIVAVKRKKSN